MLKMMNKTGAASSSSTGKEARRSQVAFSFSMQTLNQILLLGVIACILGLVYEMRSGMALLSRKVNSPTTTNPPTRSHRLRSRREKTSNTILIKSTHAIFSVPMKDRQGGRRVPGLSQEDVQIQAGWRGLARFADTASIISKTAPANDYFLSRGTIRRRNGQDHLYG